MSQTHIVLRVIDGKAYLCKDIGCDDFDQAARNRVIVSEKLFITFWLAMENVVRNTPLSCHLPSWIPLGQLPQIGKKDWQQYSGDDTGMSAVAD